jgi:large subunit ribosomal protein L25
MTEIATIQAEARQRVGKGAARAARRAALVPAVVYGDKKEPLLVTLDEKVLRRVFTQPGFFAKQFDLILDGETHRVLARDVQLHPVTESPLHVDFLRVSADTQINLFVPVVFENEEASPGLKRGGVLNVVRHDIEVMCAVGAMPQSFTVDLSGRDIGDSVHISEIALPAGVRLTITDRDFTVATIAAPTVMPVEEVAVVEEEEVEGVPAEEGAEEEEAASKEEAES